MELLSARVANIVDQAAVYHLSSICTGSRIKASSAVDTALYVPAPFSALTCRHIRPGSRSRLEYERVWQTLGSRPIESLIDLPLMTDPALAGAMQDALGLARLSGTLYRLRTLFCLLVVSHGRISASSTGTATPCASPMCGSASSLGPFFHRLPRQGSASANLGYGPGREARSLSLYQAKVYIVFGKVVCPGRSHDRELRSISFGGLSKRRSRQVI